MVGPNNGFPSWNRTVTLHLDIIVWMGNVTLTAIPLYLPREPHKKKVIKLPEYNWRQIYPRLDQIIVSRYAAGLCTFPGCIV